MVEVVVVWGHLVGLCSSLRLSVLLGIGVGYRLGLTLAVRHLKFVSCRGSQIVGAVRVSKHDARINMIM